MALSCLLFHQRWEISGSCSPFYMLGSHCVGGQVLASFLKIVYTGFQSLNDFKPGITMNITSHFRKFNGAIVMNL